MRRREDQGDHGTAAWGACGCVPPSRMLPDGSSEILPEQTAQRTRCPVFHIVARRTPLRWDAIHGLVQGHELPLIASENRPADVAPGNWCKYILARRLETGRDVADAVIRALTGDRGEPAAMAMIDELAGGRGLVPKIADAAAPSQAAARPARSLGRLRRQRPAHGLHDVQPPRGAGDRRAAARRRDAHPGAVSALLGLLRVGGDGLRARPVDGRLLPGRRRGVPPAAAAMARGATAGARLRLAADGPLSDHRRQPP